MSIGVFDPALLAKVADEVARKEERSVVVENIRVLKPHFTEKQVEETYLIYKRESATNVQKAGFKRTLEERESSTPPKPVCVALRATFPSTTVHETQCKGTSELQRTRATCSG